ncbi:hypothetical protein [Paraburkholderia domus]|uniref:hypothetical protein n=1 Tax=Paraburkholderia domus TaxID=2793075 RepID=UPI001911E04D|nr:hypothetical protein [Paraburkholderia domus]MBK5061781.1 hypothetical protein [Burkholderia sp. R-70199]CAE6900390.1 hypothetical protein R70199_03659 [Paraburkholderia domus]
MDDRTFPIHPSDRRDLPLAPQSIPYWIVEQHEAQAKRNHYQTVQRLKERQGCSWRELLAILTDRSFWDVPKMSDSAAMIEVVSIVQKADPTWMDNWRRICAEREPRKHRVPTPLPSEIAK